MNEADYFQRVAYQRLERAIAVEHRLAQLIGWIPRTVWLEMVIRHPELDHWQRSINVDDYRRWHDAP